MAGEIFTNFSGTEDTHVLIRDVSNGQIWNVTDEAWESYVAASYSSYDLALEDKGGTYRSVDMPTGIAYGTELHITFHYELGASPAVGDPRFDTVVGTWTGSLVTGQLGAGIIARSWISYSDAQAFIDSPDEDSDIVKTIVNGVIDGIERYCKRQFLEQSYSEWLSGADGRSLWIKHRPIQQIDRICIGVRTAFTLEYNVSDIVSSLATARPTSLALALKTITDGATTSTSLAYGTYPLVEDLVAAVNAVTNWTTVPDTRYSKYPTTDIRPMGARNVLDVASNIYIPEAPQTAYDYDSASGEIVRDLRWPSGYRNILFEGTVGFALADIPEELITTALQLVLQFYENQQDDPTLIQHKLGDHAWTRGASLFVDKTIQDFFSAALFQFRSLTV